MKSLARVDRDESAVTMAKLVAAADSLDAPRPGTVAHFGAMASGRPMAVNGAQGNAKKRVILTALDDENFAARLRTAKAGPNPKAAAAALLTERKKSLGQALAKATGGEDTDIEAFLDRELGHSDVTYQEIWSRPKERRAQPSSTTCADFRAPRPSGG